LGVTRKNLLKSPASILKNNPLQLETYTHAQEISFHEIIVPGRSHESYYSLTVIPLRNDQDELIGRLFSFRDITALKRSENELRYLSNRLIEIQEEERQSISRELHDDIGQLLTYAMLLVDRMAKKSDQKTTEEMKEVIREGITKVRNLSSTLSPRQLKDAGLQEALVSLIDEFVRRTEVKVDFYHSVGLEIIPYDLALAVFRIVQESLTNIARHSKANEVKVNLTKQTGKLSVDIIDNGAGFEISSIDKSTGLTGMRERALAMHGKFAISSSKGMGTRITVVFPLP